jgi:uncharacterized RDD family membrane protein YckC
MTGVSPIPREARVYQGKRAGVVTRTAAAVLDSVIVGLALACGYLGLSSLIFLVDPRNFKFPQPSLLFSLSAAFAVMFVYLAAAWAISGRTFGSQVMGLRVVNRAGQRPRPGICVLRAGFYVIFPAGLFWCAINRRNHSVQDIVLGTAVVYDWGPRPSAARPAAEVSSD